MMREGADGTAQSFGAGGNRYFVIGLFCKTNGPESGGTR
jgi:hypothetical protein